MNKYTFGDSLKDLKELNYMLGIADMALRRIREGIENYEDELIKDYGFDERKNDLIENAHDDASVVMQASAIMIDILESIEDYLKKGPSEK